MFMGVYLALCGIQYLIILIASLILIRRKVSFGELRKSLLPYSIFALSASLLGLGLFSLITIPVGNLDFNFPQDFTDLDVLISNIPKIFSILLGLAGVTSPIWALFLIFPKRQNAE
jgi:hypothetical protein